LLTVGRARPEPATSQRADAVSAHQPLDATAAATSPFRPWGGMHPRGAVTALVPRQDATNIAQQRDVRPFDFAQDRHRARTRRTTAPAIISAGRHTEHAAHYANRIGRGMLLDKGEPHRGMSAKPVPSAVEGTPTAFFKMLRSIRVRSSSRRSLAISDA
jgi:hypothetical protein